MINRPLGTHAIGSGLKFGQVYGMLSPRLRQILAEPLNLTPDPTGLQFKPGDPYATIPIGSGLKFHDPASVDQLANFSFILRSAGSGLKFF